MARSSFLGHLLRNRSKDAVARLTGSSSGGNLRLGIVLEDETSAAVEWTLRRMTPDGKCMQLCGGTILSDDEIVSIRRDRESVAPCQDYSDLREELSPWHPQVKTWPKTANVDRIQQLLAVETNMWATADRGSVNEVWAQDCVLVNPWTVEIGREARLLGFDTFFSHYRDVRVTTHSIIVDARFPGLFAATRSFECTNIHTNVHGIDEDLVFGEISVDENPDFSLSTMPRLRYARVIFDPVSQSCTQSHALSSAPHISPLSTDHPISTYSTTTPFC